MKLEDKSLSWQRWCNGKTTALLDREAELTLSRETRFS